MRDGAVRMAAMVLGMASLVAAGSIGCGKDPVPSPRGSDAVSALEMLRGPLAPPPVTTLPLTRPLVAVVKRQASPAAPPSVENPILDVKLLVIATNGQETDLPALQSALQYLGTPYDTLVATTAASLAPEQLFDGNHGKYNGIILTRGDLLYDDGSGSISAFSADEWTVLESYEAAFGVRQAALDTLPDGTEGLGVASTQDTTSTPAEATCTAAGRMVFFDVNCDLPIAISGVFAYPAPIGDQSTTALLVDGGGNALASTHTYPDQRESLELSFAQTTTALHTMQLLYGVINWTTRGLFLGQRQIYFGAQVDDLFISSDIYGSTTSFRLAATDLQGAFDWENAQRQLAITSALRFDFCVNASGTIPFDDLTAKAQAIGSGFKWTSHTYTHPDLTNADYATTYTELERNTARIEQLGLTPFTPLTLVTPGITGLTNPNAMQAAFDIGVRYLVTDTSQPGYDNPTPNAGIYNPLQPQILMIPRRPTNLYYDVTTPAEWVSEYNSIYATYWGRNLAYSEIIADEGGMLLNYLLKGENDLWMFHQANLGNYGGGHSVLSDLLDYALDRYAQMMVAPMVSPTMLELGQQVADRMAYDASGATATLGPGNVLTVQVTQPATVPITGTCASDNLSYAGQVITHVQVSPGAAVTLPITTACASTVTGTGGAAGTTDAGPGGTGGAGTGGAGTGGAAGAGGASGRDAGNDGGAPDTIITVITTGGGAGSGCGCDAGPSDLTPPSGLAVVGLALISTLRLRLRPRRREKTRRP